jgi:signal transduction histidine kinase
MIVESTLEFRIDSSAIGAAAIIMLRYPSPRTIFLSAIALLLFSAMTAGWTIYRLYESEQWVHHTFEVELHLGSVESNLSRAGRARTMYVTTGDPQALQEFAKARGAAFDDLSAVRSLTSDNAEQRDRSDQLETAMTARLAAVEKGIELAKSGNTDKLAQADLTAVIVEWANRTAAITEEMKQTEEALLKQRTEIAGNLFRLILVVLLLTFLLAVFLIWEHYSRLVQELNDRTLAEQRSRGLSLQVLRAQDEERRRIARDLHDGLGQSLAAARIISESYLQSHPNEEAIIELNTILDDSLNGARNLSYLLHPPLLDEIGLASAIEWFVEGYAKRTGINVSFEVKGTTRRLPQVTELTLFRILQESLTNIQRHAKAPGAEVALRYDNDHVGLRVRDHGMGIAPERLHEINDRGPQLGFGLTGMKHRVQEQSGTFALTSGGSGTTIEVKLPVS